MTVDLVREVVLWIIINNNIKLNQILKIDLLLPIQCKNMETHIFYSKWIKTNIFTKVEMKDLQLEEVIIIINLKMQIIQVIII